MNKPIITTIILVGIAVLAFFGMQRIDRYLDLRAIHDCAQDYRQEIVMDEKTKRIRPLEQQVRECAWQKGVRGDWEGVWSDNTK